MQTRTWIHGLAVGVFALALLALSTPALAQKGGVRGKVVDASGQPVQGATVVVSSPDGTGGGSLKTDAKGEYLTVGIIPGMYSIKYTKGDLSFTIPSIHISIGDPIDVPTVTLRSAAASATDAPVDMEKMKAELQGDFKTAQDQITAGQYDDAVATYTKISEKIKGCTACFMGMGDAYSKKGDDDKAESSYKQAIAIDPTTPDPYSGLASLYNKEKKFDLASQMSAKATELSGAAGGGADAVSVYNQGVIYWNQGNKVSDAQAQFLKATQLDPKMANAFYFLGMTYVNQGKLADAKTPFETYLSLAPTGEYADQVKGLLQAIK